MSGWLLLILVAVYVCRECICSQQAATCLKFAHTVKGRIVQMQQPGFGRYQSFFNNNPQCAIRVYLKGVCIDLPITFLLSSTNSILMMYL